MSLKTNTPRSYLVLYLEGKLHGTILQKIETDDVLIRTCQKILADGKDICAENIYLYGNDKNMVVEFMDVVNRVDLRKLLFAGGDIRKKNENRKLP